MGFFGSICTCGDEQFGDTVGLSRLLIHLKGLTFLRRLGPHVGRSMCPIHFRTIECARTNVNGVPIRGTPAYSVGRCLEDMKKDRFGGCVCSQSRYITGR